MNTWVLLFGCLCLVGHVTVKEVDKEVFSSKIHVFCSTEISLENSTKFSQQPVELLLHHDDT